VPATEESAWPSPRQLARDLDVRDLSDPADGPHAMQELVTLAVTALTGSWGLDPVSGVRWCRGPRAVPVADNYDRLLYPAGAVTREARYTRYVDERTVLRSHATAMIPPALRRLAAEPAVGDVLLVCPGIAYRRDVIDWQHTGTPHQLDLWRVSGRGELTVADLDQMVAVLAGALLPGLPVRGVPRVHPYTRAGRQVDVSTDRGWIEIGECGLAHPAVLARAGLGGCAGLAIGVGLDRLLMLRKNVPDIRLLRSADPRVSAQMLNLAPYRPVSSQPAIGRDLSVAVAADEDTETLGDRVREALGPDADAVESVQILSQTEQADLPAAAIARIGLRPGQRNLLVRIVLRRLDRTLTDAEANDLRDRIYAAIHQGTARQWAAEPRRQGAAEPWAAVRDGRTG
jgi:phenylalanyl-tRNA synthetase alpha chain